MQESPNKNVWYFGPARTWEDAVQRWNDYRGPIFVDTETIGLKGDKDIRTIEEDEDGSRYITKRTLDARTMIGIGVAIGPNEAFYFPVGRPGWKNVPMCSELWRVREKLLDPSVKKVFFNAMFDLDVIEQAWGIDCSDNFADVAVACQVQGLYNSLGQNSIRVLGEMHLDIDDVMDKGTMLDVKFEVTRQKCVEDVRATCKLYEMMKMDLWWEQGEWSWKDSSGRTFPITSKIKDCYRVDIQMIPILRKMTKRGFAINQDKVRELDIRLKQELDVYDRIFDPLGINPQSNDQVGDLLASRGHWLPMTDSKKHYRVDEEVLLRCQDPLAHMVLARRRRQKQWGTYIKPFLGLDRAYSHLRQDLATGRLGSWGFNCQNFPPSMRCIFAPDNNVWSWMDLHQAEMRVWANQAQDEVMLKEFAQNSSPHNATLKALFPGVAKTNPDGSSTWQYVASKSFNFALLADASDEVLAVTTKLPVQAVAKYKKTLYELYWKSREHQDYMRQRHVDWYYPEYVEDDFGRRCHIPTEMREGDLDTHQQKCRLNYPFQATVAGVVKRQMIYLDKLGFDFPAQVHDEILQDGCEEFPKWLEDVHPQIKMPFEVNTSEVWV